MKLASYKEFETKGSMLTFGRIGIIAAAHVIVFGGCYLVTKYGSGLDDKKPYAAGANGIEIWKSQDPAAQQATVDGTSSTLFDSGASNLAGYNAGDRTLYASVDTPAANTSNSSEGQKRFAPRRPSDSAPTTSSQTSRPSSNNDTVLRPLTSPSSQEGTLSPVASSGDLSGTIDYKVQNGDSLWGISRRFNVTVKEIVAVNPSIDASNIRVGETVKIPRQSAQSSSSTSSPSNVASAPASSAGNDSAPGATYTVKAGDSLSRIASRQGVTVRELRSANNLSNDTIRIGQELVIPRTTKQANLASRQFKGKTVTVEAGDTIGKIAAVFGVSVQDLMQFNGISDPRKLRIGQVLRIPGSAQDSTSSSNAATPAARPEPRTTQPAAQPTTTPAPTQQAPSRTLPTLDELPPPPELPTLNTLEEDGFEADDLDEQPLIRIED